MKIRINKHTLERAVERGTSAAEIEDVIKTGFSVKAKSNRIAMAKIYNFQQERLGKFYEQKRVEVFYIVENQEIITITVYVFYGKWEGTYANSI